jgi:hypothetical protein
MPGAFVAYGAIIAPMGDWDIDSPVKGDSSRGLQPVAGGSGASGRAAGPPAQAGQAPASGRTAPPPATQDPSPPGKRPVRVSYGWLSIVVVVLLVGLMAGFFIARSQSSDDTAALVDANARLAELQAAVSRSEDRNWTYYRANEALKEELKQATSSTSSTVPPVEGAKGTYGPGLYLVGEGISAGTYDGTVNGSIGYWARLKGTEGAIASIIENGIPKGPFVLTIEPADKAVELRGVTLTQR